MPDSPSRFDTMPPPASVRKVPSPRLLQLISEIPREKFLARTLREVALEAPALVVPEPLLTPPTQTVITLIESAGIHISGKVLLLGCGATFLATVVSQMARELTVLEGNGALCDLCERMFRRFGVRDARVIHGQSVDGVSSYGPFDVILSSQVLSTLPTIFLPLLAHSGVFIGVFGERARSPQLVRFEHDANGGVHSEQLGPITVHGRVGDILVDLAVCQRGQAEEAARLALQKHERFGQAAVNVGVHESDLFHALALQRGITFAHATQLLGLMDHALIRSVPRPFLEKHNLFLIRKIQNELTVASSDPDVDLGDLIKVFPALHIDLHLVTPTDYRRLWRAVDLLSQHDVSQVVTAHKQEDLLDKDNSMSAHAIALFDALLLDAIGERASDIHLERYGDDVRVRLRVDGDLHDRPRFQLSPLDLRKLTNVIKVSAELDISEQRMPQGGRFRKKAGGQLFDLRVQTQPSLFGEHVVIRLLAQENKILSIEDLGFPKPVAKEFRRLLDSPAGLLLAVGPTGSGKSTTLYACLQALAQDSTRKVITIEDPIEYSVYGVQQTQARADLGFTFANAMRAFVREDPDVILVGEIRDGETALEAIRASQTGHIVLSTLHCNDAVDAVQRMLDLGMHPNSVGSELLAVVSQRLAKRICESCRVEAQPDEELLTEVFPDGRPSDFVCYVGKGCARCGGLGTRGRIAVMEYMRVNARIRKAISKQYTVDRLRHVALESALFTARRSALELVRRGAIALSELRWVLSAERMAPERSGQPWE